MTQPCQLNPLERFTGRAQCYARYRPDYPGAALDFLYARCGLHPGAVVVDVGAGTGISSRLLAERGLHVIAVEPNDDMRRQAESRQAAAKGGDIDYRQGRGEATGLPDACADAVTCFQAFHWLDPAQALPEFHRILKPRCWAALVWNERDETDPFTHAYGEIVRTFPNALSLEGARQRAGQAFIAHPLFVDQEVTRFAHMQEMDEEQMIGRAFSVSYAPQEPEEARRARERLHELFAQYQAAGAVVLRYHTSVYTGRRVD